MAGEEEIIRIRLDLKNIEAKRFLTVKEYLGLKNDTEVIRSLINRYWREHRDEFLQRLTHFNLNEEGVLVLDRTLQPERIVHVDFRPEGAWCEHCESMKCRHVEFALGIPKVQAILLKKGWKIK